MSSRLCSAFSAASALVALESLIIEHFSAPPDLLHSGARIRGSSARPSWTSSSSNPCGPSAATAAAAFWPLWVPRSDGIPARSAIGLAWPPVLRTRRVPSRTMPSGMAGWENGDRHDRAALPPQLLGDAGADVVVNADDRDISLGDEPLLDLGIMFHRAVAIEMIDGDIEQKTEGRVERGREIDLKRRALDHMDAAFRRRIERQDRRADIAADFDLIAERLSKGARRAPSSSICHWCR